MIAAPAAPVLEGASDRLRNELSALIESIEELQTKTGPLLGARYQAALGRLEFQLLELQIDVQATRRRIELLQASVNHGTPITQEGVAEIDRRIATELADWRWQLVAREHALADAREFLAGIVLVDAGEATRVKSAYRRLARWLHPDASPENFDLFQKYWPAVQEAYRRVDRGLIEALLHLVEHALDTRAGKQSADIPSELDRLRVFVATRAERLARLRTEPPHCYAELLTDDAWVAARQSALERAIAAESERLAQLVMRLAELMARICIHRD